jgi:hypothetical protein
VGVVALDDLIPATTPGVPVGIVLGDPAYGDETAFRVGVAELGLRYMLGVRAGTSVWAPGTAPLPPASWSGRGRHPTRLRRDAEHQPVTLKALASSLPAHAWRTVTWREGSQSKLSSRFAAAVRVRPAHCDTQRTEPWPEEWLLIEWPEGEAEPAKYWFSNLSRRTSLRPGQSHLDHGRRFATTQRFSDCSNPTRGSEIRPPKRRSHAKKSKCDCPVMSKPSPDRQFYFCRNTDGSWPVFYSSDQQPFDKEGEIAIQSCL